MNQEGIDSSFILHPSEAGASVGNSETSASKVTRSEEHTSELQSPDHLVCRLLLEKKKRSDHKTNQNIIAWRTMQANNSHTVLSGIINSIRATIQRIKITCMTNGDRHR